MPCLFAVFPADLLRYEQRREVVLRNAGIGVSVGQGQQRRGKRFVGIGHEPNIVGSVLFHVERSGLRIRIVGGVERFVIVAVVGEGYGQQTVDFLFFVGSGQRRGGVVVACGAGRSAQREDHAVAVRRLRAAVRSVLAASGQQRGGSEECGYESCFHGVISFFLFAVIRAETGLLRYFYKAKREPITNSVVEHVRIMEVETQAADVRTSRP